MGKAPVKVSVGLEIPELVAPLSDDSEGVLVKGDDDEEATDCGEVWSEWL